MARHERVDTSKLQSAFICSSAHSTYALKCSEFLKSFGMLHVVLAEYPADCPYSCWYVTFKDYEQPFVLNICIRQKSFQLEFRYPQFLPAEIAKELATNEDWLYASSNRFSELQLHKMLAVYVEQIREKFDKRELKYREFHPRKTAPHEI